MTCASSENRPRLIAKLLPVIGLGLLLAAPLPARADGAFPDEMSIHFPASAPHGILLATNFGLAISEDDGATWRYSCEPYVTGSQAYANLYQVAADGAVLAISGLLTRSADVGCTWTAAAGDYVLGTIFTDANPPGSRLRRPLRLTLACASPWLELCTDWPARRQLPFLR